MDFMKLQEILSASLVIRKLMTLFSLNIKYKLNYERGNKNFEIIDYFNNLRI